MNKGLKTIEDYKSYYEDSTREQIIDDTYIDFIGYQNLAKEYSKLQQENKQLREEMKKLKKWLEEILNELKENDIYDRTSYEIGQIVVIESIIAKIEELEEGVNNER